MGKIRGGQASAGGKGAPSVFAALLDDEKGGMFVVHPTDAWDSVADYVPDTNVLQTRFRTRTGVLELTDFMPIHYCGAGEWDTECHTLYRRVEVARGEVEIEVRFQPRFGDPFTSTPWRWSCSTSSSTRKHCALSPPSCCC